ncbi:MAG: efflux RND transporter periplasmic adaptor subunit, partial [Alphaproteobacteria bacterium]
MEIEEVIRASGTIAAKQTSRIGPLVEGVVDEIFVRVGDRPRRGDPLFRTRQNDYRQAVNEAQARLDVVRAELELKQKRFVRARSLVARNLLSQEQFELTETDVAVAQAQLRSAEAALATAEQQLGDTIVHAPFDGTITGRFADEGVYMSNRFSMGGQSAVVELAEAHIVAGIMQAPEAVLSRLRLGQRALLYVGESSPPRETEVFIINDRVDPATRMAEFRLPVRNDDYAIKPGQFVRAEVHTAFAGSSKP